MNEPLVVAIVLNWNGIAIRYKDQSILEVTLKTLKKVNYKNLKVIVTDAESEDGSQEFIKSNFKDFDLLEVKNEGFGYANNKTIEYAFKKYKNLDYILLLNDDLIFNETGWLKKLVKIGEKLSNVGIVGCKLKYPDGRVCEGGSYSEKFYTLVNIKNKNKKEGYIKAVIGAVFLIKREVIQEIGGFDEIYLPFFKEETDFCERALINGYKTYYVNNTNITHLESYSVMKYNIKKKWTKEQMVYFSLRNDWIFLFRWYKRFMLVNALYNTVQAFIRIEPEFGIRSFDEILMRLKFNILGFFDAFRMYQKSKAPKIAKNKI
jgi:GT2 family glycosyltransferase